MASTRLVIVVVGILITSTLANPTARIWGGEEASKGDVAYAASIRLDGAHVCGGSIIGPKQILTAAHCFMESGKNVSVDRLAVRVGSTNQFSGGKLYYVAATSVHPEYAVEKNDIAVLILESDLVWSDRVAMINIATSALDVPGAGDMVTVAGWGEQSSNLGSHKLRSTSFSVAPENICSDAFSKNDDSNMCLAHDLKKGSCTGDAGNGAVYKNKVVAVSSFVVGACGSRYPDVYSNVAYYAPWIRSILD